MQLTGVGGVVQLTDAEVGGAEVVGAVQLSDVEIEGGDKVEDVGQLTDLEILIFFSKRRHLLDDAIVSFIRRRLLAVEGVVKVVVGEFAGDGAGDVEIVCC